MVDGFLFDEEAPKAKKRTTRGIKRDRAFKSLQPHEQRLRRKTKASVARRKGLKVF